MLKKHFLLPSMLKTIVLINIYGVYEEYKVQKNSINLKPKSFVTFKCIYGLFDQFNASLLNKSIFFFFLNHTDPQTFEQYIIILSYHYKLPINGQY